MTTTNLERREPSRRSVRGLDWLAFFLADIQTGWGPFVAGYLTAGAWAQFHIGLVLTIGTITGLVLQIPAGALIDMGPAKRFLGIGIASISASALLLALWPALVPVIAAKVLHAIASALVGPSFVAVSLGLVGHAALSERLGRNARFLSLGNAIAAGVMGAIGYYLTYQAIFFFTALLGIPTLLALTQIDSSEVDPSLTRGGTSREENGTWREAASILAGNRALLVFAAAIVLFQLANAAMLPIVAGPLTKGAPQTATAVLAILILAPQFVVAFIAPSVGQKLRAGGESLC